MMRHALAAKRGLEASPNSQGGKAARLRGIFISYRREDSEGQARALSIELARYVGEDSVFLDVDSIALGRDFRQALHERLETCDAMLALIGQGWLNAKDQAGKRRLDDPGDYLRQEIAVALVRNIPVTPVLVQGATMPAPERLPDDLKELAFRNSFELSHTRWHSDVQELGHRLGLDRAQVAPAEAPVKAAPAQPAAPPSSSTARVTRRRAVGAAAITVAAAGPWRRRALRSALAVQTAEAFPAFHQLRLCDGR
jgi:hypothetical protein